MPDFSPNTTFVDGIVRGPKWIRDKVIYDAKGWCRCCRSEGEHMHHIDKDRTNNNFDNLIFLCRKCHLLVHKIMRKNPDYRVVKGRKIRG